MRMGTEMSLLKSISCVYPEKRAVTYPELVLLFPDASIYFTFWPLQEQLIKTNFQYTYKCCILNIF